MLQEIYINNFILIDELRLEFAEGINVLSGETGAGKSIIVDALGLALGDRINNTFIRDASRKALVEAVFDVSRNQEARIFLLEQGLWEQDGSHTVIVSREINPNGRTVGRINGRNVTAAVLKTLSTLLVDIHLQSDRQNILQPNNYLDYIDRFAPGLGDLPNHVVSNYHQLSSKKRQLDELMANYHNRMQRLDFLAFQIKEIEDSHLQEGEEEELKQMRDRIRSAGKLLEAASAIMELLYMAESGSSAYDQVAAALDIIKDCRQDSFFAELVEPMENIYYSLQDMSGRIAGFKGKLDFEPGQLEECEDRIYQLSKLKNKYGNTVQQILDFLSKAKLEKQTLEHSEERQEELQAEIELTRRQYLEKAEILSQKRKEAASYLEKRVHDELLDLNMPNVRFAVGLGKTPEPTAKGMDIADFLFSPNPGVEMSPLARSASGGEISRFILALKKVLADAYHIPTLIFDEIDVGLGGSALNAVARKLAELSRNHQLILVTHAPQVACYGNHNMVIEKYVQEGRTFTGVRVLDQGDKIRELARMLEGDSYSELALRHAEAMVTQADQILSPE